MPLILLYKHTARTLRAIHKYIHKGHEDKLVSQFSGCSLLKKQYRQCT